MSKEPTACLSDVFTYVTTEEERRSVMMGSNTQDISAFKTDYDDSQKTWQQKKNLEKNTRWCDFCKRHKQTRET